LSFKIIYQRTLGFCMGVFKGEALGREKRGGGGKMRGWKECDD
jgi:hypothetical protein